MDTFDQRLTNIITRIEESSLPDEKKAEVYAEISLGLQKLVWTVLIAYIPEQKLKYSTAQSHITIDTYCELIDEALKNPDLPKDLYMMTMKSLGEIEILLDQALLP